MDAAKGRWLSNAAWVVIIIFVCGIVASGQKYIDKIEYHDKWIESAKLNEKHYAEIITTQKVINESVSKDMKYLTKTVSEIKENLIRLKIVDASQHNDIIGIAKVENNKISTK